ncbi:hypothetical protein [Kribbella sp. NPDC050459]|uniref:hypothetical protein n=1 Tax=Kribbella sp. NPDC050459 TaxID=3155785 RepID=UPI0033D4AA6E
MSDYEKHRTQADARRTVARRRTSSVAAEQAILRHLGIELYRERRETPRDDAEKPADEKPSDGSAD